MQLASGTKQMMHYGISCLFKMCMENRRKLITTMKNNRKDFEENTIQEQVNWRRRHRHRHRHRHRYSDKEIFIELRKSICGIRA